MSVTADDRDIYHVWSHEHGAWWRANQCGYTHFLSGAGFYSRDEALAICVGAHNGWQSECPPSEIPVRVDDALHCAAAVAALSQPKARGRG